MSAIDTLLARLQGVRKCGKDKWMSQCPAHNGDGRSMAVTKTEDSRILIHCFAHECDIGDILAAVGMSVSDLFPERLPGHRYAPRGQGISGAEMVKELRHELRIITILASDALANGFVDQDIRRRAELAADRINTALDLCNG